MKALEAEGLNIREAGTHSRPSADVFEFKPAPTSPIYPAYARRSVDSPLRGRTNSWRGSTHSIASIDRGTQTETDENNRTSTSHSPEKKTPTNDRPSPVLKETEHVNDDDDESDNLYSGDEDAEIETATPVLARARVVSVQKPLPPSLPPRNPGRMSSALSPQTTEMNDGFDQVDLNGTEHSVHDGGDKTASSAAEEDKESTLKKERTRSVDGTVRSADDDDFQSIPTTPSAERKDGIPGSFE